MLVARRQPFLAAAGSWSAVVLGHLVIASALSAQATLAGMVRRPGGTPVPQAAVVVAGRADTALTDADGRFTLTVPAGTSGTLHITKLGYVPTAVAFGALGDGATHRLAIVLPALAELAPVAVIAAPQTPAEQRPLLDTIGASGGGSLSRVELAMLPTDGRDPLALAFTVPGVAQATGYFDTAPIVSIDAQNSLYTQYYIDGFDNNEGVLGGPRIELPLSAIALFDVRTNTYGASLGRSSNGVVSEETVSGTSRWHGEGFVYGRPGHSFDARPPVLPPNTTAGAFRRLQEGGALGGPLGSGGSSLFTAVEYLDETQDQPIVTSYGNAGGSFERRKAKAFARIDQRWSPTQTTAIHAALSDAEYLGRGGGNTVAEADVAQHRLGTIAGMRHTTIFAGGTTTNVAGVQIATYHWYYPPTTSSLTTPQVVILSPTLDSTRAVVGSSGFQYDSRETQLNLRDELTRRIGGHEVRLGADLIAARFRLLGDGSNLAGTYTVIDSGRITVRGRPPTLRDVPAGIPVFSFAIDAAPQRVAASQTVVGAYAEDRWMAAPTLAVTYGARWDYDDLTSHGGSRPDLAVVQPRLAVNWRPDSLSVVRGGFGVYAGKLPYTIYSDALQFGPSGSAFVTIFNTPSTPLAFGSAPSAALLAAQRATLPPREIRATFARGLRSPRSYQTSAGVSRILTGAWAVSVDGVYAQTVHLPRLWDLNAPRREIGPADTVDHSADLAFGDTLRPILPQPGSFRQHTTTDTGGRAWYAGLAVTVRHQFTTAVTADASYVLSHARNDTEDINFAATNGNNDFGREWGDAVNDRRHRATVRGAYTLGGVRLGAVIDYQTGTPINRVSGRDLIGSGGSFGDGFIRNTQRFSGVPRNDERLPASLEVNPGVAYVVPVGEAVLELRADAFNVLNRANFSGFPRGLADLDPRTQTGRPGDPVVYQLSHRPRQLQLSARYAF